MNPRLQKILKIVKGQRLDALILFSPANISYLTRYRSRDSYLIVSSSGVFYLTDSRYTQEARRVLEPGIKVVQISKEGALKTIAALCRRERIRIAGFEGRYIAFTVYKTLEAVCLDYTRLISVQGLVEGLRLVKDGTEVKKIEEATRVACEAMRFIAPLVTPGKSELELAAEIEHFIRYRGASNASFDIIVGSGPNSSFPHHVTGYRRIREGEPVLIDMGADIDGYKSDLTRVFFSGKINPLVRRVYDIVRTAQGMAIRAIKPGVNTAKIDKIARKYLKRYGYDRLFVHNLGHGVGLEIHEAPSLSGRSEDILRAGMVITVEPGVYFPGKFGIRIEDMVLVTQKGCRVLSTDLDK